MKEAMSHPGDTPLPDGVVIAGHRIERLLSRGGFGKTYSVISQQDGGRWLLKEFFPLRGATRDPRSFEVRPLPGHEESFHRSQEWFYREATLMRDLPPHRSLVKVQGLFKKNGTFYILMEFIEGASLADYFNSNQIFSQDVVFKTLVGIGEGLSFLHDRRLLHRDVKPDNVMVRPTGEPVLIDFGAAREIEGGRRLTSIYTPNYAPFEQHAEARRTGFTEGPWTDIYSLGAIAYRFVTGDLPTRSAERFEAMQRGSPDPYQKCESRLRGDFTRRFAAGVDWALEFRPDRRPAVMRDWIESLSDGARREHSIHQGWGPAAGGGANAGFGFDEILDQRPKRSVHRGGTDFGAEIFDADSHRPAPDEADSNSWEQRTGVPYENMVAIAGIVGVICLIALVTIVVRSLL